MTVRSDWDPRKKVADIQVFNDFEGSKFFDISGSYTPSSKNADITVSTYEMPLDILNPFVKIICLRPQWSRNRQSETAREAQSVRPDRLRDGAGCFDEGRFPADKVQLL
ncbi:MAG: hypothetical protein MZV63_61470 [Marinilabiliales bacterium]|nr:hypothetical protein [Marinilabiliales bacterium]